MQRLIEGVHRFRESEFGRQRELLARLARDGQDPHTLFITCADSRVLAELITQSQPGDLFVVKNVGNIVPPYDLEASTNSTAAAIEFAVSVLEVDDIVVCGHSKCGAMNALLNGVQYADELPHLIRWLEVAAPVREVIQQEYAHLEEPDDRQRAAEEENVLFGIESLHSYPAVERRLADGSLHLHGWFFKIETGELFSYDAATAQFGPIS